VRAGDDTRETRPVAALAVAGRIGAECTSRESPTTMRAADEGYASCA
jgi:hypothetical protein